jgi:hypothetical protein
MPMVRAMRLLNAVEAGTLSGSQLQTLLTNDPGRLAELNVLMGMRGQARRMAASSTAMTAVIASSSAMNALVNISAGMDAVATSSSAMNLVAASSVAMTAVAASSTARNAVIASPTATAAVEASTSGLVAWITIPAGLTPSNYANMTAVAASSTAKMAIFNSDTALNAIKASATAMAAMRAAAGYIVGNNTANASVVAISGPNVAGSYIMLGYSKNSPSVQGISLFSTRRSGSTIATSAAGLTNPGSNTATDVDIALPLVSPFQTTPTNGNTSYIWYFGMLRCDV